MHSSENISGRPHNRNHLFFFLSITVMLLMAFYVYGRLFFVLNIPFYAHILFFILCVLLSQCMTGMRFIVNISPYHAFGLLRIAGFLSAFFMTLASFLIIYDLIGLCITIFAFVFSIPLNYFTYFSAIKFTSFYISFSLLVSIIGVWRALRCPAMVERNIPIQNIPSELEGMRIAHLSDLHIGSTFTGDWLTKIVEHTNAMQPDIVLITGDLVDGEPHKIARDLEPLKKLSSPLGTYIVLGNHEYYSGAMPWINLWREWDFNVLINENITLTHNDYPFVLAGLADMEGKKFPGFLSPDLNKCLNGVSPNQFTIMMEHQPKNAAKNAEHHVNLQVSGHTHGGQYFFLFPLIKFLNKGFRSGYYKVDAMSLYVSPGTGLWGYVPMRMGSKGEITLLSLIKA